MVECKRVGNTVKDRTQSFQNGIPMLECEERYSHYRATLRVVMQFWTLRVLLWHRASSTGIIRATYNKPTGERRQ